MPISGDGRWRNCCGRRARSGEPINRSPGRRRSRAGTRGAQRHGERASGDFARVVERRPDRLTVVSYCEGVGDDPGPFAQLRQWGLRNPGRLAVLQSVFWTLMVLGWLAVVDLVIGSDVLSPVSFVTMPVAGAVFGLVMYRLNREATAKAARKGDE